MMINAPKQLWRTVKKKDIFEERRTHTEENRRSTENHREKTSGETILCEP
jgi:hypothetical protein